MSANTLPAPEARQKLNFDFDEEPAVETKEELQRKIEDISERSGFNARAPQARQAVSPKPVAAPATPKKAEPAAALVPAKQRRRRAKTGRTFPFATKLREDTYDKICALADFASEKEGRPVTLAEVIERGMDVLEKQMKA